MSEFCQRCEGTGWIGGDVQVQCPACPTLVTDEEERLFFENRELKRRIAELTAELERMRRA